MKTEAEIKQALWNWVVRNGKGVRADELTVHTPLLERNHISSLQLMDLIMLIEHLGNRPVDVTRLKAGDFRDLETIYEGFFASVAKVA